MNLYEVPLYPENQVIRTSIVNKMYTFRTFYCDVPMGGWVLDLADDHDNEIINGLALVSGTDILGQFAHLNLGFSLIMSTGSGWGDEVGYSELGTYSKLYVVVP